MSNTTTAAPEATVNTTTAAKIRIRPAMLAALTGVDAAGKVVAGNVRTLRTLEAAGLVASVSEVKKTAWITDAGRGVVAQHSKTTTAATTTEENTVSTETTEIAPDVQTTDSEWEYATPEGVQADEPEGDPQAEAETDAAAEGGTVEADAPAAGETEQQGTERANTTPRVTVDRILALRKEGKSYGAIAEQLMAEGLTPSRATAWRGQTVRAIIVRELGADNVGTATSRRKAARTVWVIPTKRDGVQVFATEDDGLTWLAAQTGSLPAPVQVPVLDAAGVAAALGE